MSGTRGPDILTRSAPALSATSDAPLLTPERPPVSASNNAADQAAGVAREISPEARAAAAAAARDGTSPAKPAAAAPAAEGAAAGDGKPGADGTPAGEGEAGADGKAAGAEGATPPGEGEGAGEGAAPGEGEEIGAGDKWPDGTPPWVKREMTKARNRQREAERIARDAREQANTALRALEALKPKEADAPPPVPEQPPAFAKARPTRDQFDNPEAFESALVDWTTEKTAADTAWRIEQDRKTAEATARQTEAQRETQQALTELQTTWEARKAKAMEELTDYVAVAERDDLNISTPMAHAIMVDEHGPRIAYYLGKNPAEADRIAAIKNPGAQLIEMGKLSAKLSARPRVPRSEAPAPIEPLTGSRAGSDAAPAEPSMDDYGSKRLAELRAGRQPFTNPGAARGRAH